MKIRHLAYAVAVCVASIVVGWGQGSILINDPTAADAASPLNDNKYKLTAAEQAVMDRDVLPKIRAMLAHDACEEEISIAGRGTGAFTKAGTQQTFIFYQFCQTGNGLGSAGLAILDHGKLAANFVAADSGWTIDSSILPDIDRDGLNEIALYYSGGMHQGEGGTGVDIVQYSAGNLKGLGWFQSDGFTESGPVFGYKVTTDPGARPVFYKQKFTQNASGKWRAVGKPVPLKLGDTVGKFEVVK